MQKENNHQLTSSRRVGMRDINALLQTISRIKTLRDDEGRSKNVGQALPDDEGCSLFNLINPSPALRASSPARGEENTTRAFTLIELLVVVLIIGILAAVALPQYQLAVNKSRFIKYRAMAGSLVKAVYLYYDEHGDWPRDFTSLDIELPAEMSANSAATLNGTCGIGTDMYCCIVYPVKMQSNGSVSCGDLAYSFVYYAKFAEASSTRVSDHRCMEKQGLNFCNSLQGNLIQKSDMLLAPGGARSGYSTYRIP